MSVPPVVYDGVYGPYTVTGSIAVRCWPTG